MEILTTSKTRPEKLILIYGFIFQSRGARAVFQFYPENSAQIEMITSQAMKSGFTGGILVDYPNSTKAKKFFLVLMTGGIQQMPKALGTGDDLEAGSRNQVRIPLHLIINATHHSCPIRWSLKIAGREILSQH